MTPDEAMFYLLAISVPLFIFYKSFTTTRTVKVTELWVYPVKSCKGTKADSVELTKYGLKGDREYMIVYETAKDKPYRFLTQREYPQMALITPRLTEDGLTLSAPNLTNLFVKKVSTGQLHELKHFAPEMKGIDQGDEAADWLSRYTGKRCRLMRFPESQWQRPLKPTPSGIDGVTKYADGYPILVANEASLKAVNKRLPGNTTMRNFRPNIIITGTPAWEENKWELLVTTNGENLYSVKHCDRCSVPSVNPETGTRMSFDPRKGCKTGRELGMEADKHDSVYFGENLIFKGTDGAVIKVGDILKTKYEALF